MAGGGGSPCLYQNADFFNGRFLLCHKKNNTPPKNRTAPPPLSAVSEMMSLNFVLLREVKCTDSYAKGFETTVPPQ
jgi:hypothetical protein